MQLGFIVWASLVPRLVAALVRGVAPNDYVNYLPDENGKWHCLGNPGIVLDFSQINDDYCDCPDGSDEPGTAACPNGRFYCENAGFRSSYIPSSRVNDGVCDYQDCCDGTDEWSGIVSCPSRCKEINEAHEKEAQAKSLLISKGLEAKKLILSRSNKARLKVKEDMRVIKHKIKAIKFDLEGLVEHREETEIEEEVQTPLEQLDPQLNSAKKFVESQRNELRQSYERLAILEALLDDLAKNYNPNFNDPVVKAAVQDFQNYASNNQVVEEETVLSLSNPSEEFNRIIEEFESGLNSIEVGTSAQEDSAETTECSIRKAFNQKFENFIEKLIASPKREKPQKYTRGKLDSEIEEKEKEIAKLEKERSELEYDLTDPKYGPDGILRSYNGHCLTKKIGDYDYKFCFTGSVNQIGAGQSVLIGSMDKVEVQEDHSLKIFFEHGARCWNGPIRKAVAHVECGAKDDILFTSEPEKCEYFFKVVSPIACKEIPNSKLKKDEL